MVTPTTHAQQRAQHLARQARSDALKQLREGEPVWITVPDFDGVPLVRCRVIPVPWDDLAFTFYGGEKALCLLEGKLQAATIVDKDGIKVYNSGAKGLNYHIPLKRIFGIVTEATRSGKRRETRMAGAGRGLRGYLGRSLRPLDRSGPRMGLRGPLL